MEDLISVIVPVYNSEKYIGSCVESVLAQSYSAFELILIEDGSKDHSLEICEALCKRDTRIRLVKQEHRGVSAARNIGIETAQGKYLFFLDSDDVIHPQLLESLYKLQDGQRTVIAVEGMHYGINEIHKKAVTWKTVTSCKLKSFYLDNKKALKYINRPIICGIGGKMISRRAIGFLRFIEGLSHGEDTLFIYQLLVNGADFSVLCYNWYYYRIHKDNASRDFSPEACRDRYEVERYICNSEMRSGRRENAIYREWNIVVMITEWYETGRACQDKKLIKYIKNLAKKEKRLKIFNQLNWWMRLYFYLIIYFYPFSRIVLMFSKNAQIIFRLIKRWIN